MGTQETSMKYAIYSSIALILSILLGILLMKLVTKKETGKGKKILLSALFSLLIITAVSLIYLLPYQKAEESALEVLKSDEKIEYVEEKKYYAFLQEGNDTALIFYPGAKVDEKAYARLAKTIAEEGIDVYVVKMPFHMALFGSNRAEEIIEENDYERVYLAGHSLGGTMASSFASSHEENVHGLILLASYPSKKIPDSVLLYSIYGDKDGCLEKEAYENSREYWPERNGEAVLPGGNHAQFGEYGKQKGDGTAEISAEEQISRCAEEIVFFIKNS